MVAKHNAVLPLSIIKCPYHACINHSQIEGQDRAGRTRWSEGGYRYVMNAIEGHVWCIDNKFLIFYRYCFGDGIWMRKFECHSALFCVVKPNIQFNFTLFLDYVPLPLYIYIDHFVIRRITSIDDIQSES